MPISEEAPPDDSLQPPCEELIVYGVGHDINAEAMVDQLMMPDVEEAKSLSVEHGIQKLAEDTTALAKNGPWSSEKQKRTAEATDRLVEAVRVGSIAEEVVAVKGCARCIESGACPLEKRLTEHKEISRKARTVLERLHQEAVRVNGLQALAGAYDKWSDAQRRIDGSPAIDLSDIRTTNDVHQQFVEALHATPDDNDRDKLVENVYGFIPKGNRPNFRHFMNGVASELYVYEALDKVSEALDFRVRLATSQEDLHQGTDIVVIMSDNTGKKHEIPIDVKSPGAFHRRVNSKKIQQLDKNGYFGMKDKHGQKVLVVNPEGVLDQQDRYSTKKIGNTNCQSFKRPRHSNRFALAAYTVIQQRILPQTEDAKN